MDFLAFAERFGLPVTLVLSAMYGGAKKLWVWGYQLTDMTADRDFYRTKFFSVTDDTREDLDTLIEQLRVIVRSAKQKRPG